MHSSSASKNKTIMEYLVFTSVKYIDYIVEDMLSTSRYIKGRGGSHRRDQFSKETAFAGLSILFSVLCHAFKAKN